MEHWHCCSRKHLRRERQQGLCLPRSRRRNAYPDSNSYGNCNAHSHYYSDRNCNCYGNCNAHSNSNSNCNFQSNIYTNAHCDRHGNIESNIDPDCHGNCESDTVTQTNSHSEIPCDTEAAADSAAKAGRTVSASGK